MRFNKKTLVVLGLGCVACCAPIMLPLLGISGAAVVSWAALSATRDVLLCLVPVVLLAVYVLYRMRKSNGTCCTPSGNACNVP